MCTCTCFQKANKYYGTSGNRDKNGRFHFLKKSDKITSSTSLIAPCSMICSAGCNPNWTILSCTSIKYTCVYRHHLHREYVLLLEFCIHVFALLANVPRRRRLTLPGVVICVLACLWVCSKVQPLVTYLDISMIDWLAQHCWHQQDSRTWIAESSIEQGGEFWFYFHIQAVIQILRR